MHQLVALLVILLALRDMDPGEEKELLLQIREGNHQAFEQFFKQYHSYLYHYLMKRGVGEQQAEDLVQQAFVMVWEKRNDLDPEGNLRAFLFRIAYTRMLNVFRDSGKFDRSDAIPEINSEINADQPIENEQLKDAIDNAVSSLPGKRQDVFRLCYLQQFTYRQAGDILGISEKTVENHMGLALKDLRAKLKHFL